MHWLQLQIRDESITLLSLMKLLDFEIIASHAGSVSITKLLLMELWYFARLQALLAICESTDVALNGKVDSIDHWMNCPCLDFQLRIRDGSITPTGVVRRDAHRDLSGRRHFPEFRSRRRRRRQRRRRRRWRRRQRRHQKRNQNLNWIKLNKSGRSLEEEEKPFRNLKREEGGNFPLSLLLWKCEKTNELELLVCFGWISLKLKCSVELSSSGDNLWTESLGEKYSARIKI